MGPQVYSMVMFSTRLIEIDKKSGKKKKKTGHRSLLFCSDDREWFLTMGNQFILFKLHHHRITLKS